MAYSIRIVDHNVTHHREADLHGFHLHPWLHCLDFIWLSSSCTGEVVQMLFGNGTSRNVVVMHTKYADGTRIVRASTKNPG